jgi:hypothetical protein
MDNFYKNYPAVMSDGRTFTDYKSETRRNEYIKYTNDIRRDDDYRMFLQKNGKELMDKEFSSFKGGDNEYRDCVHNYPTRSLPHLFAAEMNDYNALSDPNHKVDPSKCTVFKDYRLTEDADDKVVHPINDNQIKYKNMSIDQDGDYDNYLEYRKSTYLPSEDPMRTPLQKTAKVKGEYYDKYLN